MTMPSDLTMTVEVSFKDIPAFVKLLEAAIRAVQARQAGDMSEIIASMDYLEHCILELGVD